MYKLFSIKVNNLRNSLRLALTMLLMFSINACAVQSNTLDIPKSSNHRMLVLTDIEADPDDAQTLVRLLLYSNQIDLQGIVATTSVHQQTMVAPESIYQVIDAYAKVRDNLAQHEADYPEAQALRSLVKKAQPLYGMQAVGKGMDSEGSDWIIKILENDDPRPLWLSAWGGVNTLAQALFKLKQDKSPEELSALVKKLRVYTISDQDDSAAWIRKTFPDLFYIVSPGGYGASIWTGISTVVNGIDNSTISNRWLAENIQQDHGPMGQEYPDVAYGMEGDTPSWLNLIQNGLNMPSKPNWGGWGGRYEFYTPDHSNTDPKGFTGGVPVEQETRPIWTNAIDTYAPPVVGEYNRSLKPGEKSFTGYRETLWRWRDAVQNDFAARMDWTIKSYDDANHPPVINLKHPESITVKSGQSFHLDARGSSDPDGDSLQFYWFNYAEIGSMKDQVVKINSAENMARVHVVAPNVEKEENIQFILQVTDRGAPALTRYQRVFVKIVP